MTRHAVAARRLPRAVARVASILAMLLATLAPSANAGMLGFKHVRIDFTESAAGRKNWIGSKWASVTTAGIGWVQGDYTDWWFQTLPLAVGWSWRPVTTINVRIVVSPPPQYIIKPADRDTAYFTGRCFVRFSPDLAHWSSWQSIQRAEPRKPEEEAHRGGIFGGEVAVPDRDRSEYREWLLKYQELDVPWKSDEEAAVRWMLARAPSFFSTHMPYIGYVEFMFEPGTDRAGRITTFSADISYGVGGLSTAPKSGKFPKDDVVWRFRASTAASVPLYQPEHESAKH